MQKIFYGLGIYWFLEHYGLFDKWYAWAVIVLILLFDANRSDTGSSVGSSRKIMTHDALEKRRREIQDGFKAAESNYVPGITNK